MNHVYLSALEPVASRHLEVMERLRRIFTRGIMYLLLLPLLSGRLLTILKCTMALCQRQCQDTKDLIAHLREHIVEGRFSSQVKIGWYGYFRVLHNQNYYNLQFLCCLFCLVAEIFKPVHSKHLIENCWWIFKQEWKLKKQHLPEVPVFWRVSYHVCMRLTCLQSSLDPMTQTRVLSRLIRGKQWFMSVYQMSRCKHNSNFTKSIWPQVHSANSFIQTYSRKKKICIMDRIPTVMKKLEKSWTF